MAIIRNENLIFNGTELNLETLKGCIDEHKQLIDRYNKLRDYYDGKHSILNRTMAINDRPNNRVLVNHAEYITDFATAYFIGNPVNYQLEENSPLQKALEKSNLQMVDTELSREVSIYGVGYELVYQNRNGDTIATNIDPRNAFIVVDDTVEYNTLFGVHYYDRKNAKNETIGKTVNVYTATSCLTYFMEKDKFKLENETEVVYGMVPLIEYWNKSNQKGDFESVLSLIDAYNVLQSDRVNDKEQFVNALLVIYGVLAGDTSEERINTAKQLKKEGLLEMPIDTRAEFITKAMNESDNEVLRKAIENDIHKIAKVPNLTDENFAGNASGVAMKYKLLGLEQLAQTKESYYRIGLKERLRLFASALSKKMLAVDIENVQIDFKRSLPANDLETSQMVANLTGKVSDETLVAQISFVEDPQEELERIKKQNEENIKTSQQMLQNTYEKEHSVNETE